MRSRAVGSFFLYAHNYLVQNIKIREGKRNKVVEIAHFVNYGKKYTICDLVQFPISHL